jgi:HAMP domain-containing protein
MNPANAPTRFESTAIERLRETKGTEYSEIKDGNLLFARTLIAAPGCLKCHSTPEAAPAAVRAMYGTTNGFGYKQGDLAGIISVIVPLSYNPSSLVQDFSVFTWTALGAFLLSPLFILLYIQRMVVSPVRKIKVFAEKAAHSELSDDMGKIQFVEDEYSSDNEVHRLSAAIKAMYQSIRLMRRDALGQRDNVTRL